MPDTRPFSHRAARLSLAALAICLVPLRLPAADPPPGADPGPPFFAMDTATGGGPVDARAQMLEELGYAGMSCALNRSSDLPAVLEALDERGLKLFAIYAGAKLGADGATIDEGLAKAVGQLKGRDTIVWLTVNGRAPDAGEQAVRVVREVADLAGAAGLRVALYPHAGFHMASVADAVRLAKESGRDNVGVTFNLCHWLKEGRPDKMLEDIRLAAPRLFVVTINGADRDARDWKRLIQPLDRGDFEVGSFLAALREAGFRGPVGFQGYGIGGEPRENLRRTIAAWRELSGRAGDR